MCYFLLLAYIKFKVDFKKSLFYLHKMVQDALFMPLTIIDLLKISHKRLERFKSHEYQFEFL